MDTAGDVSKLGTLYRTSERYKAMKTSQFAVTRPDKRSHNDQHFVVDDDPLLKNHDFL
jgi:hypothetical protein